ncbi:hypothetical protein ACIP79_11820 [Streptomyces sp. NPDC088747]|uniref:hypothetical protein n=1 Tax=Streptomyces sp. NPDC088747 TaxID=3365886 RepID=UPI00382F95E5
MEKNKKGEKKSEEEQGGIKSIPVRHGHPHRPLFRPPAPLLPGRCDGPRPSWAVSP